MKNSAQRMFFLRGVTLRIAMQCLSTSLFQYFVFDIHLITPIVIIRHFTFIRISIGNTNRRLQNALRLYLYHCYLRGNILFLFHNAVFILQLFSFRLQYKFHVMALPHAAHAGCNTHHRAPLPSPRQYLWRHRQKLQF